MSVTAPVTAPSADSHHALPIGLRLGELEIRSVIGVGGFGIVYHAFDHALERDVAIKEYMPSSMAARSDTLHVSVLSQGHAETFTLGLRSFVNEARLLARFDHPSLVKVHRFWEANGTAYMVMPLYRGRTLKALRLATSESPSEAWLRRVLEPLLGALEVLHAEGVFHRDIAPDNILVGDDGRPVLLDFGAARRVIGDKSQALTAILKPSYAPIEQYAEANGLRQGPWTDLYALGATLHFAVAGQAPQPATARALGTDLPLLAASARRAVSEDFLRTIDWMMAPRPEHRPQGVAALREVLSGRMAVPVSVATAPAPSAIAWQRTVVQTATVAPTADTAPAPAPTTVPAADVAASARSAATAPPPRSTLRERRSAPRPWVLVAGVLTLAGVAAAAWQIRGSEDAAASALAAARTQAAQSAAALSPARPGVGMDGTRTEMVAATDTAELAVHDASTPTPVTATAGMPAAQEAPPRRPSTSRPKKIAPQVASLERTAVASDALAAAPSLAAPVEPVPPTAVVMSPRDQCRGRVLMALYRCMKQVCKAPELSSHPDCERTRQLEARNSQGASN